MAKSVSELKISEKKQNGEMLAERPGLRRGIESLLTKERGRISRLIYEQIDQFVQNSIITNLTFSEKRLLDKDTEGVVRIFRKLERLIAKNVKEIRKHISELKHADETSGKLLMLKLSSQQIKMAIKRPRLKEKIKELFIEEREGVAQHLHDEILQNFATISVGLQLCEKLLTRDETRVLRQIGDLKRLAQQTVSGISEFCSNPSFKDFDGKKLIPALKEYIKTFQNVSDCKVNLVILGIEKTLASEIMENLLQIIKEALVNVVKHAEASEINLELNFQRQRVFAAIADNGKGFNLETEMARATYEHLGLTEMRKRVESSLGTLSIKTMPGCGTEISVSVPTGFL